MYTSEDLLLIEIAGVFLPAIIITVFTFIYNYQSSARYKRVLQRLYKMSFKGIDFERKRIASELHDHLAIHSISISEDLNELKNRLQGQDLRIIERLENDFSIFRYKTHQIVEYMYPKVLVELNWESSLELLASQLSIGKIKVTFESHADSSPAGDWLYHTYWAIQELITNAIRHANIQNVQITAIDEDGEFILSIHYRATEEAKKWIESNSKFKPGMGTMIILDRLSIVDAKMKIEITDGVVTHSIILKNENSNI
jgi:signal transduction histidine kinase